MSASRSKTIVSILESGDEHRWDNFVEHCPEATFFHLAGWRSVIETAFGHKTFYLVAKRHGEICGVVPLTLVKSNLFGKSLISNAFCVEGGILADSVEEASALRDEAIKIGRSFDVGCIEFRSQSADSGWQTRHDRYAIFRRPIDSNREKNLLAIPRKQRAVVRKAIESELKAACDKDIDRFHHIYAVSVRRLGTPVFSRRYFRLLNETFGHACEVLTVWFKDMPIASVMNFYFRDQVLPYYGGGLSEARTVGGNDFMYWTVMCDAAERGFRIFDFGRSKVGSGSYAFKRNWGFEPTPLAYEYFPVAKPILPDISPSNPEYQLAINLWRRLPLPLTKLIGPSIVRNIG